MASGMEICRRLIATITMGFQLIMVSVGLDTVKQIESQLMQRNYEGFLK